MNLYKLHTNPKELIYYDQRYKIPGHAWEKIQQTKTQEERQKLEQYIKTDPNIAYQYARRYLKSKRFYEAEPYIMKDPSAAYRYAWAVIKGRWPEAEKYINQDEDYARFYRDDVLNM